MHFVKDMSSKFPSSNVWHAYSKRKINVWEENYRTINAIFYKKDWRTLDPLLASKQACPPLPELLPTHVSRHRTTSQAQNSCKKWNVPNKLSPYYTSLAKSESLSDPLTQCNQALYKRDLQILTQSSNVGIYMLTSFLASMPSWLSPRKKSAVYTSQQTHCWRKADEYIQPTSRNKHFYSGNFKWMSVELCHS